MDMVVKYFEVLDKLPLDIVSLLMGMQEGEELSQEKSNVMESVMQRQASDMKLIGNREEDEELHHQELCPQQDHFKVMKSEVSPLLIAIAEENVSGFKQLLNDKMRSLTLRDELRGPFSLNDC